MRMTLITATKFNLEVRKKSKTRRGNGDTQAFNSIAQATNNKRCPVLYYKEFRSHGPAEVNIADNPFYLAINHRS